MRHLGQRIGKAAAASLMLMLAGSFLLLGCGGPAPEKSPLPDMISKTEAQQQLESAFINLPDNYAFDVDISIKEAIANAHRSSKIDYSGEIDASDPDNLLIHMNFSTSGNSGDISEEFYWNGKSIWVVVYGQAYEFPLADYEELDLSKQIKDTTDLDRLTTFLALAKNITSRKDGDSTIITIEIDAETLSYLYNLYLEEFVSDSSLLKDPVITYLTAVYTLDKDGVLAKTMLSMNVRGENPDGEACEVSLNCSMALSELGTAVVPTYGG